MCFSKDLSKTVREILVFDKAAQFATTHPEPPHCCRFLPYQAINSVSCHSAPAKPQGLLLDKPVFYFQESKTNGLSFVQLRKQVRLYIRNRETVFMCA